MEEEGNYCCGAFFVLFVEAASRGPLLTRPIQLVNNELGKRCHGKGVCVCAVCVW